MRLSLCKVQILARVIDMTKHPSGCFFRVLQPVGTARCLEYTKGEKALVETETA